MGDSVTKQAVPIVFFEELRRDRKLCTLLARLLNCGGGMANWFTSRTVPGFEPLPSPIAALKQHYQHQALRDSTFDSEADLEAYSRLLEERLAQFQAYDPLLAKRRVLLESQMQALLHGFLTQALAVKFPTLEAPFAHTVFWGGEAIQPNSDLLHLPPDQVSAIAHVLSQIEVEEWLCYFDDPAYAPTYWRNACHDNIQTFKRCFMETAQRRQVLLTRVG